MKKHLFFALTLSSAFLFNACKSQESAYKQAYEKARAQEAASQVAGTTAVTTPAVTPNPTTNTTVVNVQPVTTNPAQDTDVRTINAEYSVVNGSTLKNYSVVVGSFVTQANAVGLMERLKKRGFDSRVLKTNETINGQTGWYRVIASSYTDKPSAAASRQQLTGEFPGAWLLYTK